MAIGDPYATTDDLISYLFKQNETKANNLYESDLMFALKSATKEIERHCGRQFNQQTGATARTFVPTTLKKTYTHDFWTTDQLVIESDPGGVGDFVQEWDADLDVEIFPLGGIVDQVSGWPYNELRACRGLFFPKYAENPYRRKAVVRVTAQWGWEAVPDDIHQACLIMAASTWKLRDAPFGVAGFSGMGGAVKVRNNPMAQAMIQRYVLNGVQVG